MQLSKSRYKNKFSRKTFTRSPNNAQHKSSLLCIRFLQRWQVQRNNVSLNFNAVRGPRHSEMDLKCFGGNKCPEWVIAGLFACSKFDAPNSKSICMTIAAHAAGEALDEDEIKSILSKYKMDTVEDIGKVLGSVLYVLKTTAKWDSDSAQLAAGMRTIRISNHMIRALRSAFDEYGAEIASSMRKSPLTLTKLKSFSISEAPDAAIDCTQLNLSIDDCIRKTTKNHSILLEKDDLKELISELKKARKYME